LNNEVEMIDMATEFDPYLWLGVREVRRPLNAYELLGVPILEEDVEIIRAAVGQRCAILLTRRDEAPEDVWNQVFREIEEAARVLLDPDRKAAYDLRVKTPAHGNGARHGADALTNHGPGTVTTCRFCQAMNPATRKFCSECGSPLWEVCRGCGSLCVAGERFCGACGAKLEGIQNDRADPFEEEFQRAEKLQNESQFDQALNILIKLSKEDRSQQASVVARAKDQIKQLAASRNQAREVAQQQFEEAQKAFKAQEYQAAQQILESIPPPLRTSPMLELLANLQQRNGEAEALNRMLEQAVAAKKYDGLLAKISRLLELQPDHPGAWKVAGRLQERICASAKLKLEDCQYESALKIIRQIPENVRLSPTKELYEQIAETAWLVRELRQAPIADKTLLAISQKLSEVVPNDPITIGLCDKAKHRVLHSSKASTSAELPWAAPPKEPFLGFAVERPIDFRRITLRTDLDQSSLLDRPSSFFVAAGLALQGVGQAALEIDLAPAEDRTVLQKFSQIMRMRIDRSSRSAWGIDLGCSGLKAVKITWDERKQTVTLLDIAGIEHCKPLNQAANEMEEDAVIQATLQQFLKRGDLKVDRICLGLPARLTLSRQLKLPPADPAKLDSMVRFEAERQVPLNLKDLVWDYQAISGADVDAPAATLKKSDQDKKEPSRRREPTDVLLIVIKRSHVERRMKQLQDAGLHVDSMQCDALALHNWLSFEHSQSKADNAKQISAQNGVTAALDVGDDSTNFIVYSPRVAWYRPLGIGCQTFLRAIVQSFKLDIAEANCWKHSPELAPSLSRLYDAIDPAFGDLAKDVRALAESYHKAHPRQRIEKMMLVGGGSRMHGLLRYLRLGR
jgi:Tfp pilus assembly PilM family ATPase/tetratricopeptide (TPR) repeat protein